MKKWNVVYSFDRDWLLERVGAYPEYPVSMFVGALPEGVTVVEFTADSVECDFEVDDAEDLQGITLTANKVCASILGAKFGVKDGLDAIVTIDIEPSPGSRAQSRDEESKLIESLDWLFDEDDEFDEDDSDDEEEEEEDDGLPGDVEELVTRLKARLEALRRSTESSEPSEDRSAAGEGDGRRRIIVPADRLRSAESEADGIPVATVRLVNAVKHMHELRAALTSQIKGQSHAIESLLAALFRMEAHGKSRAHRNSPRCVCLFAGPPGVGKTFLAETVAKQLKLPYFRADMSGYNDRDTGLVSFAGVQPTYKAAAPGQVTSFVKENPACVLLFDEIEKADPAVINLFLQILDRGVCRDLFEDKDISFRDAIVFFTTNAGRGLYEDSDNRDLSMFSDSVVLDAIASDTRSDGAPFFPPPIVSRMSAASVIMFNHLDSVSVREIAGNEIETAASEIGKTFGKKIVTHPLLPDLLLYAAGGKPNARTLKGRVAALIDNEVCALFDRAKGDSGAESLERVKEVRFTVDTDGAPEDVRALFEPATDANVLIFGSIGSKTTAPRGGGYTVRHTVDLDEAKTMLRGEVDMLVIDAGDIREAVKGMDFVPCDLEDIKADGNILFAYARENYPELPVYIADIRAGGSAKTASAAAPEEEMRSYLRRGARGMITRKGAKNGIAPAALKTCCAEVHATASAAALASHNKVLAFNAAQIFSEDGTEVEIRFTAFSIKKDILAGDSADILADAVRPTVRFSDVIGVKEAKEALAEFAELLSDPRKAAEKGMKMPRGVLLYGPPGTGKTLLAKAMAGESDVTFIQKNATEFLKKYVGEGPRSVREAFRLARQYAPSVLFIDEIDSVAKERIGGEATHATEEILTTLLTEMDGFVSDPKRPVLVIAATNYDVSDSGTKRALDPALLRRFDRRILVGLPDTEDRKAFLEYYLKKHGLRGISADAIANIAARTPGESPAKLESMVEYAIRKKKGGEVTDADLAEAVDAVNYGAERTWSESAVRKTAVHEAGHALVSWLTGTVPEYLTVVSRGGHGGYMMPAVNEDKFDHTRGELLDNICVRMGGRAAEQAVYGEDGVTTGASSDLMGARRLVIAMACEYGMFDPSLIGAEESGGKAGELLREIVGKTLTAEAERALALISANRETLDALADMLRERNSLTRADLEAFFAGRKKAGI